jgi:hypothetical protein
MRRKGGEGVEQEEMLVVRVFLVGLLYDFWAQLTRA